MRVKELKPNTEYATASGRRVKTMDTVERGWNAVRTNDGIKAVKADSTTAEKPNPWAENRDKRRQHAVGMVVVANGIRVTEHHPVEELAPEGFTPAETVVDPADIKGTWAQYVEAQGHVLENKRWQAKARTEAKKLGEDLNGKLAGVPGASVQVRAYFTLDDGTRTGMFVNDTMKATGYELETHLAVSGNETVAGVIDFLAQQTDQG